MSSLALPAKISIQQRAPFVQTAKVFFFFFFFFWVGGGGGGTEKTSERQITRQPDRGRETDRQAS